MKIKVYIAIAQDTNPGPSGYAALLRYGPHERLIRGSQFGVYCQVAVHALAEAVQKIAKPAHLYVYIDKTCLDWMQKRYDLNDLYLESVQDTLRMIHDAGHKITWVTATDDRLYQVAHDAARGAR